MGATKNYYRIAGPFRPAGYEIRRVINGVRMAVTAHTRTLPNATRYARALRTRDARTNPERAAWPLIDADNGMIIERGGR